jgi:hypothetical protein
MASTYTEGLVIELIGSGDKAGSWGDVTNNNLKSLNQGITGFSEVDLSGAIDPYLIDLSDAQVPDESTSPSRSSIIKFINVPDSPTPFRINFQVNTAPAQRINCVVINGDDNNTISVGTGANGDRLTILNGYAASVYSEVNSGNSSYFDIKNSLANLSVDKIALENNEIIGNATDDKITIGASTLEVGDGVGAAVIKSDNNDLIFKTDDTTTNRIRINHGSDDDINVNFDGTGSFNVGGDITTTSAGSITAAGNISTPGNISTTGSGTITSAGLLTVSSGGASVTGNSTIAGTLGSLTGLTLSSGSIDVGGGAITNSGAITASGNVSTSGNILTTGTGAITSANGLTVSGGGAAITGASSVTGSLAVSSLNAGSGTIQTTGTLSGGTTSVGGLTATSLNLSSGNITNAGTINSGAITSSGSIGGASLDVGSGAINGGAITGASLSAGSGTIGGGAITGTSLTVGTGASNTITAGELICNDLSHATSITSTISSSNKFRVDANGAQVVATNGYLNMSSTSGSSGFGFRNNSGTLEIKNSTLGGWGSIAVLSGSDLAVSGSLTAGTSVTAGSTVTAGTGLTVTNGGANITGNSTVTGTLGGITGLTVASGGATISGNSTLTGTLGGLTGLTVASGGASISGGLNNNGGGITNAGTIGAGAITSTSLNAVSGTIQTTGTISGGTVVGTTSVTTPTLTSVAPNGNLTLSPAGIGKIILDSSSTSDFNNGSAITLDAVGAINFSTSTTDYTASIIGFALRGDTGASVNRRVVITSDGLSLIGDPESTRYLGFSTSRNTASRGFRSNSAVIQVRSKNTGAVTDDWGRIYHSGMASGDGAYFEGTCAVTANTEQNITTGFSSIPSLVTTYLECTTADAGYSIGDHVLISSNSVFDTGNTGVSVTFDGSVSNDVTVTIGSGGLYLLHKTTNGETALIESSWRLRVKAWK